MAADRSLDSSSLTEASVAFLYAAEFDDDPVPIASALAADPELISVKDDRGWNALHLAAGAGNTRIVETLLAAGADPNAPGWRRATPLHRSVLSYEYSLPSLTLLVKSGARINTRNTYWQTPLMVAAHGSNLHAVTFLLGKGARTDFRDRSGMDAIDLLDMSCESAKKNPKKFRQQIKECKIIRELLQIAMEPKVR